MNNSENGLYTKKTSVCFILMTVLSGLSLLSAVIAIIYCSIRNSWGAESQKIALAVFTVGIGLVFGLFLIITILIYKKTRFTDYQSIN